MRTGLVTLVMIVCAFSLFLWEQYEGASLMEARTTVINVIVAVEIFYLLNCRSLTRSLRSIGVFSNLWVIGGIIGMILAQLAFTYAPVMNRLFHTSPITGAAWLRVLLVGLAVWAIVGLEKWLRSQFRSSAVVRS